MKFLSIGFFHQKAPSGPLRGTLERFNFMKIHRNIEQKVGSLVYDTPQNDNSALYIKRLIGDSDVYLTLQNGDSSVYLTPRN